METLLYFLNPISADSAILVIDLGNNNFKCWESDNNRKYWYILILVLKSTDTHDFLGNPNIYWLNEGDRQCKCI